jgi:hypothetical protein
VVGVALRRDEQVQIKGTRMRAGGFALDDWLQAEGEILRAQERKAKAARGSQC